MVRIIEDDNITPIAQKQQPKPQVLDYRHHILLSVIGQVVAEAPSKVRQLLDDYSIELSRECPDEELADTLILAIGECDENFNRDLASLILDRTLNSSYDQYDFKQLAGQAANILSNLGNNQNADGQNPPGVLGGLTSTIGQIGGIIGQGIQAAQSQSASEHAKQGIMAHRRQMAEQQAADEQNKNNLMLFLLLTALGIGILGFIAYIKRQAQPTIKTS